MDSQSELSRILYNAIIGPGRTPRTPSAEQLASELQKSTIYVYKLLEGELPVKSEDFILIFRAIRRATGRGPIEALRYLVSECDPALSVIDPRDRAETDGQVHDDLLRLGANVGKVFQTVQAALSDDGHIDRGEEEIIRAAMAETQAALDGLAAEMARARTLRRTA